MAQEAQEDSISSLSHGLRTPLNTIMGFSDMIRRQLFGDIDNPSYLEYAGLIHESAEHLLSLVDRTLEQAARQQVGLRLDEQWFEPGKAIERSLRMFSEQAQRARIELQSDLGEDLPWLKADRLHLMQMLTNVIGNAIKIAHSGGSIRITAKLEPAGTLAE